MARATTPRTARARQPTADSYGNFLARLGVQQQNLSRASTYQFNLVTRRRIELEAMYRGSWIIGQAVDIYAEDMTAAGIEWTGDTPPEQFEKLNEAMTQLGWWNTLTDWIKWARLYGGAIAVMLIDGQNVEEPLAIKTVGKDQFKGFYVFGRWELNPNANQGLVGELGPHLGKPEFYTPVVNTEVYAGKRIHYTRVLRMDGVVLPYYQRKTEDGWGMSVIERILDRLVAFDSTTTGTAQLAFKAYLRTLKIKGLTSIIAKGGSAMAGLANRVSAIREYQSAEGLTLIDADDEFDTHTYNFAGLDGILIQFGQQLAGALKIPLVRLFGQAPAGMDSTGESDLANYREGISTEQESRMRQPLGVAAEVLYRSVVGADPPPGFGFAFRPLKKISLAEKSQIGGQTTQTILAAKEAGVVSDKIVLQELKQSSEITGIWTNIQDEDIEAADDTVPDPAELMAQALPSPDGKRSNGGAGPPQITAGAKPKGDLEPPKPDAPG